MPTPRFLCTEFRMPHPINLGQPFRGPPFNAPLIPTKSERARPTTHTFSNGRIGRSGR